MSNCPQCWLNVPILGGEESIDKNKQTMTIPAIPVATTMTRTDLPLLHRCNCAADAGVRRLGAPRADAGSAVSL